MDVGAEDEEALSQVLEVLPHADVAVERGDLLVLPGGEGVGPGRGHLEPLLRGEVHDQPPEPHQLGKLSLGSPIRSCTMNGSASALRSAAAHAESSTSHPSTIPAPPYSSLGLRTSRSRFRSTHGTRSMGSPPKTVFRSSTTRVHGTCSAIAAASPAPKSPAFRSSESTASEAFWWRILQRNGLAMQTAPVRTARTIGWSSPPRSSSSRMRTRL